MAVYSYVAISDEYVCPAKINVEDYIDHLLSRVIPTARLNHRRLQEQACDAALLADQASV